MLDAQKRGVLPFNTDGYVLGEYARRQANSYLSMYVGLQAIATTSVFVPLECPIWQFLIEIRLPQRSTIGVFGMLDVDARSGELPGNIGSLPAAAKDDGAPHSVTPTFLRA